MPAKFTSEQIEQNFWQNVNRGGECWLWNGKMNVQGYGVTYANYKGNIYWNAHRLSYGIHHGSIPKRYVVMHTCDNPWCVNPEHLRAVTQLENAADCKRKGRNNRGERNRSAKLTEDDVRFIRQSPLSISELAGKFDIDYTNILRIIRRERWSHVQ